jgi:hypothetical protein
MIFLFELFNGFSNELFPYLDYFELQSLKSCSKKVVSVDIDREILFRLRKISVLSKFSDRKLLSFSLTIKTCQSCKKNIVEKDLIYLQLFGISVCDKCMRRNLVSSDDLPIFGVYLNEIPEDFPRIRTENNKTLFIRRNFANIDEKITLYGLSHESNYVTERFLCNGSRKKTLRFFLCI